MVKRYKTMFSSQKVNFTSIPPRFRHRFHVDFTSVLHRFCIILIRHGFLALMAHPVSRQCRLLAPSPFLLYAWTPSGRTKFIQRFCFNLTLKNHPCCSRLPHASARYMWLTLRFLAGQLMYTQGATPYLSLRHRKENVDSGCLPSPFGNFWSSLRWVNLFFVAQSDTCVL